MWRPAQHQQRALVSATVIVLLFVLFLQLAVSVARDSSSWDEGNHIYAGYRSWTHADFGLNPEHPPLVKLLATAPLLPMKLLVPEPEDRLFMQAAFLGGRTLLIENDADAVLWRSRMAEGVLTLMLALVTFAATREMFGVKAGLIALLLVVFEPNLLAHGARVTTDAGVSLFLFATTYAFYRYVKTPSLSRLALVAGTAGLTIASKHTGLFVFPILALLIGAELLRSRAMEKAEPIGRLAVRLIGVFVVTGLVAVVILWATYGFKFAARPEGLALNPPFAEHISRLNPAEGSLVTTAAQWRLLPESYLYGLAAVRFLGEDYHSYALGTPYPQRVWFYFPLAFSIKSTLGFLGLFGLSIFAIASRRLHHVREVLFLTIPPALYFLVAMVSGMNIGIRHILPVYVFLAAVAGGAAWSLAHTHRRWAYAVGILITLHVASSARAFPHYMPYANEAWGGSSQTYRHLTDSSVDWGEQLKSVKRYCDEHGVKDGWFAYFAQGVLEPRAHGIPLRPLPTPGSLWVDEHIQVPPTIEGTVLISAGILSGFEFGPSPLDPYSQFRALQPHDVIDDSIFVYKGRFEIPLASAFGRAQRASALLAQGQPEAALAEAEAAVGLAPDSVATQTTLGETLTTLGRHAEARSAFKRALMLAKTVEPAFQKGWISALEGKLEALRTHERI